MIVNKLLKIIRNLFGSLAKKLNLCATQIEKTQIMTYIAAVQDPQSKLISDSLGSLLLKVASPISVKILLLSQNAQGTEYTRNITINKEKVMTYCPKGKETILSDKGNWKKDGRQESSRYGRVISKVLAEQCPEFAFTNKEMEEFVNLVKAELEGSKFKIVRGDAIADVYNMPHIGVGSCMADKPKEWFDVYTKNESACAMLILLDEEGVLRSRAITWKKDNVVYIDRLYGEEDAKAKMRAFAEKNNWVDLRAMSAYTNPFYITLNLRHDYFPYMDTLYKSINGQLTTADINNWEYHYQQQDGTKYLNTDYKTCQITDERLHVDELRYVDSMEAYVSRDLTSYDDYSGNYFLKENAIECVDGNTTDYNNPMLVECSKGGQLGVVHCDYAFVCGVDGNIYHRNERASIDKLDMVVHVDNETLAYETQGYKFSKTLDKWLSPTQLRELTLMVAEFEIDLESAKIVEAEAEAEAEKKRLEELKNVDRVEVRKELNSAIVEYARNHYGDYTSESYGAYL